MAFTDAQVAAYIRDNKLDDAGIAKAANVFGLSSEQINSSKGLLSSGASSVNDASNAYKSAITASPNLDKQNRAFYDAQTGTGYGVKQTLAQQINNAQQSIASSSGYSLDDLASAGRGAGSPGFGQSDPFYDAKKHANDQVMIAGNLVGRAQAPSDAVFRSTATFNPITNTIELRDRNGVHLTGLQPGTMGGEFGNLDRLATDPASYQAAVAAYLAQNPANKDYITAMAGRYQPRNAAAADASFLRSVPDPRQDATAFFANSQTPSIKEFMDKAGVDFNTASAMLSSNGLGSAAGALVDWQKVMASPDPARALNAAYAAISADPRLSQIASQAVSKNYAGWNMGGAGVAGDASGGGYAGAAGGGSGGAGTGGGGPLGMPTTGINLSQLQNPSSAQSSGMPTTGINLSQLQGANSWDVQPNEAVRSQLQQIIADDSPLMQQARTRALQTANSRGLLNSSMAMTAADSAMYDAAMPIATQDASTYARAGEFNSNTKNTFSRDNNQFVRDAYMADFNVQANDWAAQQQFEREYKMLDRQQQLTLERDAIQNGYASAREQFAAQQQTIRDDKESALRLRLAQMDSSVERQRIQIDAQTQSDNVANLNALRSEYADKVFRINTSDLSPEKADKAVMDLAATYNPMITAAATRLGYDPNSWIIKIETPVKKAEADGSAGSGAGGAVGGGMSA